MTLQVDACVAGGGPAGAGAAASLARLGYRVAVLAHQPRPPIGESLSPGTWPLLDTLGISRTAVRMISVPVVEAGVRWRTAREERVTVADGLTVDRSRFDALLLEHARDAGALVLPVRAHRPARTAGGWRVPSEDGAVEAPFLIDASGRQWLLGGHRKRMSSRTLALHARWPSRWPATAPQTRIAALRDGWLWCARLPGGDVRAMAFIDPEWLANSQGGAGQALAQLLVNAPEIAEPLDPLPRSAPVRVCDATSYCFDNVVTLDSIRVGEAAFGIDPLSSSGVQTALQTGLAAAATVHSVLSPNGDAAAGLDYYAELVRASATYHRRTSAALYAEHRDHASRPFWRHRSERSEPVPQRQPVPLAALLPQRVRLRPPAELRTAACRVGDRIVRQQALTSLELDRPVAFLAGTPLAPLIEELEAAPSLAVAVQRWERALAPGQATAIVSWLVEHNLVEVARGHASDALRTPVKGPG